MSGILISHYTMSDQSDLRMSARPLKNQHTVSCGSENADLSILCHQDCNVCHQLLTSSE